MLKIVDKNGKVRFILHDEDTYPQEIKDDEQEDLEGPQKEEEEDAAARSN